MRREHDLLVTKAGRLPETEGSRPRRRRSSLPASLEHQAVRRLRVVATGLALFYLPTWVLMAGPENFLDEFRALHQWVPPTTAIVASALVVAATRSTRFAPYFVLRLGLVFQVLVSYSFAVATQWGGFRGMTAGLMDSDVVGLTFVVPWMLFYTAIVPTRPRHAVLALAASASAPAVIYQLMVSDGIAPPLAINHFLGVFVVPYLTCVALGYVMARVIHGLSVAVREAREMGAYRLEVLLGKGGMGEVWRASHRLLARPAAIKLIRQDALASSSSSLGPALARFEQEAQVTASLRSPHTVELYDFGTTEDGTLYYVMELLEGFDLDELVERFGPLPPERVVHILRQACGSLAEAHERGLVHRDIKPANLHLSRQGLEPDVVKVLDFGLVKPRSQAAATPSLTKTGAVAGTPSFLAPETILDKGPVDHRADIYALGCVAFWLLTGRLVFEESSPTAMMVAHAKEPPSAPSQHTELPVPTGLDELVLACLAKDPADRPQTAGQLAEALESITLEQPWTTARATRWWTRHQPAPSSG